MADTADASAPAADTKPTTRPTRPDENAFKEALAKAEKAHKASMDQLVRIFCLTSCGIGIVPLSHAQIYLNEPLP